VVERTELERMVPFKNLPFKFGMAGLGPLTFPGFAVESISRSYEAQLTDYGGPEDVVVHDVRTENPVLAVSAVAADVAEHFLTLPPEEWFRIYGTPRSFWYEAVKWLLESKSLVWVDCDFGYFSNMVVSKFEVSQTKDSRNVINITIEFTPVQFAAPPRYLDKMQFVIDKDGVVVYNAPHGKLDYVTAIYGPVPEPGASDKAEWARSEMGVEVTLV